MHLKISPFRAGYVAIVGRPNVGKSTLLNHLIQQKLAIVTPKPQTTRHRILGILNGDNYQVVFLDTPGIMQPKYFLQKRMLNTTQATMKEADLILMMIEVTGDQLQNEKISQSLKSFPATKFLIINKIDLVDKNKILPIIDRFQVMNLFQEILPISALKKDGLNLLLSLIVEKLPEGLPFYSQDVISDEPERFFVAEIIREKIFFHFGEEIPYATSVHVETFEEKRGHKDFIRAVIYVERNSQKGILIGKGGQALKKVGSLAREDIEHFLKRPVFLELQVQIKKKWRKDAKLVTRLGY
ncbi:GTPase Era [bacterium]|nr:GTPase Era [bacterium]RQV93778.1 MAG: GTPase Era [bacterium]